MPPAAALRTGRDSLPSSGPHSPPGREYGKLPVREQAGVVLVHLLQPGHGLGVLALESLELAHGPPGQVVVDAPCKEVQLGAVEGPVVVAPAPDLRIDSIREAGQVRAAAQVEVPGPDLAAFRFLRCGADRRAEAREVTVPSQGLARPEGIAEEVKAGVLVISPAVRVLAVHDLRLDRMQFQAQPAEPATDSRPQLQGLPPGFAMPDHPIPQPPKPPPPHT